MRKCFAQSRPFNLLVFQCWSICSKGPKGLTFYSWVLWATESGQFPKGEPWTISKSNTDVFGTFRRASLLAIIPVVAPPCHSSEKEPASRAFSHSMQHWRRPCAFCSELAKPLRLCKSVRFPFATPSNRLLELRVHF